MAPREPLKDNAALFEQVLGGVNEAAYLIDEEARFCYVNKAACRFLGYSADELLALTVQDINPDFSTRSWPDHWNELRRLQSITFEGRHQTKNGTVHPVEIKANQITIERQVYILSLVRDITQRKNAEQERLTHLRFFKSMDKVNRAMQRATDLEEMMSDVLDMVLSIFDCDRAFLLYPCDPVMPSWQVLMERTRPEYPGALAQGVVMPMDSEVEANFRLLLGAKEPVRFGPGTENPLPTAVAQRFGFKSFMATALYPNVGKPWQFGIHQCSHARQWTTDEQYLFAAIGRRLADGLSSLLSYRDLLEAERKLRAVMENHPDFIARFDGQGRHLYVNPAIIRTLGITREKIIGKTLAELPSGVSPEQIEALSEGIRNAIDQGIANTHNVVWKTNQGDRFFEVRHVPEHNAHGRIVSVLGIGRDFTDIRRAEQALQEKDRFIHTVLDTLDKFIIVLDRDFRILLANRSFCQRVRLPESGVLGRRCYRVMDRIDRHCFQPGSDCLVRRTFERGTPQQLSIATTDPAGANLYLEIKSYPRTDASGTVTSAIVTFTDITERMRLQDHLRKAQKMEAIGTLAGGIAHDFNNILGSIFGYCELALLEENLIEPSRKYISFVVQAARRAKNLIRQILTFSRESAEVFGPIQPAPIIKEALKMLRSSLPASIIIEQQIEASDAILGDATQLHQIIMNLFTNAYHAMREHGGTLTVSLKRISIHEEIGAPATMLSPGTYLHLMVGDSGCGMDEITRRKIFDPYFTTKGPAEGTGLGLAMVAGIVEKFKGDISVDSVPGIGTTFHIHLPVVDMREIVVSAADAAVSTAVLRGGTEHIVAIDDEEKMCLFYQDLLGKYGYRVSIFTDSEDALATVERDPSAVDLVLTDLTMPVLDGVSLARRLLALNPSLAVILCSGYSTAITLDKILPVGISAFLPKPFSKEELLLSIRGVLDKSQESKTHDDDFVH